MQPSICVYLRNWFKTVLSRRKELVVHVIHCNISFSDNCLLVNLESSFLISSFFRIVAFPAHVLGCSTSTAHLNPCIKSILLLDECSHRDNYSKQHQIIWHSHPFKTLEIELCELKHADCRFFLNDFR